MFRAKLRETSSPSRTLAQEGKMKQVLIVIAFFPLVAFCIAAVIEVRSNSGTMRLWKLVPILFGVAAFLLSLDPQSLLRLTPASSVTVSRVMTIFSAIIACSGVFMIYSRRSSAVWVACGGLVLAFFWMFNRVVV
jgi:hypothetical protein